MIAAQDHPARLIASRLAALGHPPDYLARDAMDALVRGAAGSEQRLRAGLAGALFLAATEDAPRVDRLHVQRALEDAPPAPELALPASRRLRVSPWAALPLFLAAALLFRLARHHERPAQPVAVEHRAAPAAPAAIPPIAQHPVVDAAPPAAVMLEESPPIVSIVIGPHTRQTAPELQALAAILRQAGLPTAILHAALPAGPADPAVSYFYAEDRRLADRVARILDARPYPQLPAPGPRLVGGQAGTVPPGSVEIRLP